MFAYSPDGSTDMGQVGRRQLFLQEQGPSKIWLPTGWLVYLGAHVYVALCERACAVGGRLRKLTASHSLPTVIVVL